jgi:hypothetical protein
VFTFVKSQQGMGKIKQLFMQPGNVVKLETCKQELNHACQKFKVYLFSCISELVNMIEGAHYWVNNLSNDADAKGCQAAP